jgi:hypothetical protein
MRKTIKNRIFRTIVESVTPAASCDRSSVSGTILPVLSALDDVDVGARPKQIALAPLQSLERDLKLVFDSKQFVVFIQTQH